MRCRKKARGDPAVRDDQHEAGCRAVGRPRRRGPLLPTLLVLALAVIAFLVFADYYTDWLWYKSIGFSNVYSTRLRAQIVLFLVFGIVTGGAVALNAWLAYRFRPPFRGLSVEQQSLERYRVSVEPYRRYITPILGIVIGLMAGSSASAQWRSWLMFRNSVPFGQKDPQFRMDVSFFAFRLPFWRYLLGFGFAIVLLSLVVTLAVTLPLRRHQDPDAGGAAHAGGAGAPVGAARRLRAAEGRGLLAGPVRPRARSAQAGRQHGLVDHRCHLHRRQRDPAGEEHPARHGADLRRAVLRQRLAHDLAAAGARPRPAGLLRRRHRWHLPGDRAAVQGPPERADQRGARTSSATSMRRRSAYDLDGVGAASTFTPSTAITPEGRGRGGRWSSRTCGCSTRCKVQASFQHQQQIRATTTSPDPLDIDRYRSPARSSSPSSPSASSTRRKSPPRQQNWANLHTVYTHGFGFVAAAGNAVAGRWHARRSTSRRAAEGPHRRSPAAHLLR